MRASCPTLPRPRPPHGSRHDSFEPSLASATAVIGSLRPVTSVGVIVNHRSRGPVPTSRPHADEPSDGRSSRCEHSRRLPWTQTLHPVCAFSSKPSTSNTTDWPATWRAADRPPMHREFPVPSRPGVVHREHVRRPADDEPHPPDAARQRASRCSRAWDKISSRQGRSSQVSPQVEREGGTPTRRRPVIAWGTARAPNGASRRLPTTRRRGARLRSHSRGARRLAPTRSSPCDGPDR